jgi:SNF2-related domain/Helicase conserved C-terminal domain/SWIM zinc finger
MSISARFVNQFTRGVRDRGKIYQTDKLVRIVSKNHRSIHATASGTELYTLNLEWDQSLPVASACCDCPYFEENGLCKHLWGLLLTLDGTPAVMLPRRITRLSVSPLAALQRERSNSKTKSSSANRSSSSFEEDDIDDELDFDFKGNVLENQPQYPVGSLRAGSLLNKANALKEASRGDLQSILNSTGIQRAERASGSKHSATPHPQVPAALDRLKSLANLIGRNKLLSRRKSVDVYYCLLLQETAKEDCLKLKIYSAEPSQVNVAALNSEESETMNQASGRTNDNSHVVVNPKAKDSKETRTLRHLPEGIESLVFRTVEKNEYQSFDPIDAEIIGSLISGEERGWWYRNDDSYSIEEMDELACLARMCHTGRLFIVPNRGVLPSSPEAHRIEQVDFEPARVEIGIDESPNGAEWVVVPRVVCGNSTITSSLLMMSGHGLLFYTDRICQTTRQGRVVIDELQQEEIRVPKTECKHLLRFLCDTDSLKPELLPDELKLPEVNVAPRGRVTFENATNGMTGQLTVLYNEHSSEFSDSNECFVSELANGEVNLIRRDLKAENQLFMQAWELEAQQVARLSHGSSQIRFNKGELGKIATHFLERDWVVEISRRRLTGLSSISMEVKTGIDWFDIEGEAVFGELRLSLPDLLKRVVDGNIIELSDGKVGMLPPDWLGRMGRLLGLGQVAEKGLRFQRNQGFLLDAMLSDRENIRLDEGFLKVRDRIREFNGIQRIAPAKSFKGKLRGYQKDGHDWLHFLREFGLGGCLADDMGLGKTIQVLAMLETRRQSQIEANEPRKPSLLVVPKSLVFNWIDEAKKFTPGLNIVNFHGKERRNKHDQLAEADVIITTYGTLRIDIETMSDISFDYAILDEAQAIKNPTSLGAKACRLIRADHRLALSGTPVENRLDDLWSIFEFLNPGMLGTCGAFNLLGRGENSGENLERVARALKPMLLRRTKQQVLKDLPAKNEQTIVCELEPKQRKLYDEVLSFYRSSLKAKVAELGLNKAKIHVLEALTRLRQIACHPGMIDPTYKKINAAKLEILFEQLVPVLEEGHKALIFSQFTSLLAILSERLKKQKIRFEYLDGKTTNRKLPVDRFNNDPNIPLFLLSMKAGGHGLNLTSADYVYILDPWWNPAVEAQAVDRAHRIGQVKPVFAYRMIAKNTVEEKIAELQSSKRQLADAIISADSGLIKNLSIQDLELLLE